MDTKLLFIKVKRNLNGSLLETSPESGKPQDFVERWILNKCYVKTIGQRCADWIIFRQFRVTGTLARRFYYPTEVLEI